MKTVDFHAHPVTNAFRQAMSDLEIDPIAEDGFPLPERSAEAHIEFMENAGIDHTVLSVPTPYIYNGDARKACLAAREINLSIARICKKYPDQFGFAACVPLPCVEGAVGELR